MVSGIIGVIAGPFAAGPFTEDIDSWFSSLSSSEEDLVVEELKMTEALYFRKRGKAL